MCNTLNHLEVGTSGVIEQITAPVAIKRRLMDMGLVKGTRVHVEKLAPLGNPMQISLKGYALCIRKEDTEYIQIA